MCYRQQSDTGMEAVSQPNISILLPSLILVIIHQVTFYRLIINYSSADTDALTHMQYMH